MTHVDKCEDIADTEDAVANHHPVKKRLFGSSESEVKKIAIGQDYQNIGNGGSCQKIGIITIVQEQVL